MKFWILLLLMVFSLEGVYAEELTRLEKRIEECNEVLAEVLQMPDKSIPAELLSKCAAVAVFPYVIKGGFFFGASYGKGIVVARNPRTGKWRPPAFFSLGGESFGFQIGAQAVDLILVIMNKRGLEGLLSDKLTLGADAAVSAGPVGRNLAAEMDVLMKAGIFSYSRSKGLFAGVALTGTVIMPDKKSNQKYYGGPVAVKELLLDDKITPPASSKELLKTLRSFSN